MQKKIFWATFTVLGLVADMALPLWWALAATIPIGIASWWFAYRTDWFGRVDGRMTNVKDDNFDDNFARFLPA